MIPLAFGLDFEWMEIGFGCDMTGTWLVFRRGLHGIWVGWDFGWDLTTGCVWRHRIGVPLPHRQCNRADADGLHQFTRRKRRERICWIPMPDPLSTAVGVCQVHFSKAQM